MHEAYREKEEGVRAKKMVPVIFSHGLMANRYSYANVCREMASHGCIVYGLDHHDGSASYVSNKENVGIEAPEENYVLLNQRPEGNRYLMESSSGLPLEEYLRDALGKRGIRFRSCDFSTMRPTEQVQICLGAKVFISALGAAFANVVFTPPRCLMLEYNFRKYWNCDPACDAHFHGRLADHEECDGVLTRRAYFHKADFHNLCHLLGRPYSEMEVVRYGEFYNRNPICRSYMFVDGAALLSEIEAAVALSDKDLEKMEKK